MCSILVFYTRGGRFESFWWQIFLLLNSLNSVKTFRKNSNVFLGKVSHKYLCNFKKIHQVPAWQTRVSSSLGVCQVPKIHIVLQTRSLIQSLWSQGILQPCLQTIQKPGILLSISRWLNQTWLVEICQKIQYAMTPEMKSGNWYRSLTFCPHPSNYWISRKKPDLWQKFTVKFKQTLSGAFDEIQQRNVYTNIPANEIKRL